MFSNVDSVHNSTWPAIESNTLGVHPEGILLVHACHVRRDEQRRCGKVTGG